VPELPEVETTRRGIAPHLLGRRLVGWHIREPRLRWPVVLPASLRGQRIEEVARRAKYLGIRTRAGTLIIHLGMSGSLRVVPADAPAGAHAHVDLLLDSGFCLRFTDPRRFGSIHYEARDWLQHWLLRDLGPEPAAAEFCGDYLFRLSRGRRAPVKTFIMDGRVVVGVGNIYANEALHTAGIRPGRASGRVTLARYERLAVAIRETLRRAIEEGGTTLRDFVGGDGSPGYFGQRLRVYGREGEPCRTCRSRLRGKRIGQRATVYCPRCQT